MIQKCGNVKPSACGFEVEIHQNTRKHTQGNYTSQEMDGLLIHFLLYCCNYQSAVNNVQQFFNI